MSSRTARQRCDIQRPADRPGWRQVISRAATLAGQGILLAAIVVTPWLLGGVELNVQIGLLAAVATALVCWLVKFAVERPVMASLPSALVPLVAMIALGLLQLVPLNRSLGGLLSPHGDQFRGVLFSDPAVDAEASRATGVAIGQFQPLSMCPAATRHDLALICLAVAVFFLAANLFHTPKARLWLCSLTALDGAAIAFFGFVQQMTWNGRLFWTVTLHGGAAYGPFVCRNNAGGFLNLCLAGAVGLAIWVLGSRRRHALSGKSLSAEDYGASRSGVPERLRDFLLHLNAKRLAAIILTVCIVAGILCALSRGAFIAMIGATVLTAATAFTARRQIVGGWYIALVAAAGLGLVGWVGMTEAMQLRLATLLKQNAVENDRTPLWKDGIHAVPDYWRLGSGLGTYRYVYEAYQQRLWDLWYCHAENQYLETLVECGIPGLALLLAMIILVAAAGWRLLRAAADRGALAFAVAGIFALASQAIANFFDLGLYVPSNMILLALFCGALSSGVLPGGTLSGRTAAPAGGGRPTELLAIASYGLAPLLALALLGACLWGCRELRNQAVVEAVLTETTVPSSPRDVSLPTVLDAIERLTSATEFRPDTAEAHDTLARLWMFVYRLQAWNEMQGEAPKGVDRDSLWPVTSAMVIHRQMHLFAQSERPKELNDLRNSRVVCDNLRPALKHLLLARQACPLFADVQAMIGELCGLVTAPAADATPLENARRLAPGDPHLLFQIGQLEFQAGRTERAYGAWRQCLALSPAHEAEILDLVGPQLQRPDVVEKLLPPSVKLLLELAQGRYAEQNQAAVQRLLVQRAETLLDEADLPEAQRWAFRGEAHAILRRYPEAIAAYSRALEQSPREIAWHYQRARILHESGQSEEAVIEAKWCALAAPGNSQYQALVEEINRRRLKPAGEIPGQTILRGKN